MALRKILVDLFTWLVDNGDGTGQLWYGYKAQNIDLPAADAARGDANGSTGASDGPAVAATPGRLIGTAGVVPDVIAAINDAVATAIAGEIARADALYAKAAAARRAYLDPLRDGYLPEPTGTLASTNLVTAGLNAALVDAAASRVPVRLPVPPPGQEWMLNAPLLIQDRSDFELLGRGYLKHYPGNNFPLIQLAVNLGAGVPEQWRVKTRIHGNMALTAAGAGGVLLEILGSSTAGPRIDAACGLTVGSNVVTDAAAVAADVGKAVTSAIAGRIPAGVKVGAVTPGVSFTMVDARTGAAANALVTVAGVGLTLSGSDLDFADMMPDLDIDGVQLRDYIVKSTGSSGGARAFRGIVRGRTCSGKGLWLNQSDDHWTLDVGSCYEEPFYMDGGSAVVVGKAFFAGYANNQYPADVAQVPRPANIGVANVYVTANAARSDVRMIAQDGYGDGVFMDSVHGGSFQWTLDTAGWSSDGATTFLADLRMQGCEDCRVVGSLADRGAGPTNPTGDYGIRWTGSANKRCALDMEFKGAGGGASTHRRGRITGLAGQTHTGNDIRINGGKGGIQFVAPTARVDAACATTNGSATVTDAAVVAGDVGKAVSGPGIPAGAVVNVVTAGVSFTMKDSLTGAAVQATATANPVSLAFVAPVVLDLMDGNIVVLTMPAGAVVISNPQADSYWAGIEVELHIKQDAVGGRTVAFGSLWKLSSDFVLDPTATETTVVKSRYDGLRFRYTGSAVNVPA